MTAPGPAPGEGGVAMTPRDAGHACLLRWGARVTVRRHRRPPRRRMCVARRCPAPRWRATRIPQRANAPAPPQPPLPPYSRRHAAAAPAGGLHDPRARRGRPPAAAGGLAARRAARRRERPAARPLRCENKRPRRCSLPPQPSATASATARRSRRPLNFARQAAALRWPPSAWLRGSNAAAAALPSPHQNQAALRAMK